MTWYDGFILFMVVGSAFAGFMRGGARELVTLVSFVLAALIAFLALPVTGPFFRHIVHPAWIGTVLAIVLVFIVCHIAIRAFGGWLSAKLHQGETLGQLDRIGGVVFGLARGFVLIGVLHLMFAAATPPERLPGWFRNAALYPVSAASAKTIQAVLPKGGRAADRLTPVVEASVRRGVSDEPKKTPKSSRAYDAKQRARMDDLVESSK